LGLKIKELIPIGERILREAGVENYWVDAEALLCSETGFDRKKIFLDHDRELDDVQCEVFFGLINRRADGEPLQYITGEQYFMGHRLTVNPSVLIPRPETECLAEKAIEYLLASGSAKTALDLCTGSGALAVSIAKACTGMVVTAADVSKAALVIAKVNAATLGVSGHIDFVQGDLFASLEGKEFDLIVTNPPYVKTADLKGLAREIAEHEPLSALDGGADGLDFYRRIAADARGFMAEDACLMAEIGSGQAEAAAAIFTGAGFSSVEISQDLSGLDRILTAKK